MICRKIPMGGAPANQHYAAAVAHMGLNPTWSSGHKHKDNESSPSNYELCKWRTCYIS